MDGNMKNAILLISFMMSIGASAQVSLSAGGSMLKGFSPDKPYGGFHLGLEIPRDDAVSFYGKFTHHFKQNAADSIPTFVYADDFTSKVINTLPSMNYNIIEGGTRYYLGDGFDYGWAGYGGSMVMLVFNKVKVAYEPFDEVKYEIDNSTRLDGSIFSLGFGLGGGVKYSTAISGTFYFDVSLAYMIFGQTSTTGVYTNLYNPLIFNFNLGYRKDIIW
jgi:hypothetical protein